MRSAAEARRRAAASELLRSRHSRRPWRSALGAALALLLAARVAPAQQPPEKPEPDRIGADAPRPTQEQVDDALGTVKADPNLAFGRTVRILQWRSEPSARVGSRGLRARQVDCRLPSPGSRRPAARWSAAAVVSPRCSSFHLARRSRARYAADAEKVVALSYVRDLDIRPRACLRTLAPRRWRCGIEASTAALALLYRGLLAPRARSRRADPGFEHRG